MDNTTSGLNIFRAGTHTASDGTQHTFTADHVREIAASYDPKIAEAPLVVGHPQIDAPAYGWTQSLIERNGELYAQPAQVEPAFAELVNTGRYKKISASIYLPDTPGNPKPGQDYLKHIGFLGAAAPAVKGLRSASFAAGDGALEFSMPLAGLSSVLTDLFQRMRDYFVDRDGIEKADLIIPHWQIRSIGETANWPETHPSFSEAGSAAAPPLIRSDAMRSSQTDITPETTMSQQHNAAEFAERERKLNDQVSALDVREKALKDRETAALRADAVAFAEGLVKAGQVLPRHQAPLVELLTTLPSASPLSFSEGEQQVSKPAAAVLREFLTSLPKQVDFSEKSGAEGAALPVSFAGPPGAVVDATRAELHSKAVAYQRQHPGTAFVDAVKAVGGG